MVSTRLLPLGLRATHLPALPVPVLRVPAPLPVAALKALLRVHLLGVPSSRARMVPGSRSWEP